MLNFRFIFYLAVLKPLIFSKRSFFSNIFPVREYLQKDDGLIGNRISLIRKSPALYYWSFSLFQNCRLSLFNLSSETRLYFPPLLAAAVVTCHESPKNGVCLCKGSNWWFHEINNSCVCVFLCVNICMIMIIVNKDAEIDWALIIVQICSHKCVSSF